MTLRTDTAAGISEKRSVSRRRFLAAASTGIAGSTIADSALADTLTDVPPREPGAPLSGHSERSKYVHLSRIPGGGPGRAPCRSQCRDQFEDAAGQARRLYHAHRSAL